MHPMPGRRVSSISLASWTPLADIGNTERILAVLAGGRLLNRKELDELLAAAEAAVNRR